MKNVVKYSNGFADGIEADKMRFMTELAYFVAKTLEKYIDSQAKANPDSLHHVYEWGQVGKKGARLFEIEPIPGREVIRFSIRYLASESTSDTATEPFIYKAETMEKGMTIVIAPKFSDYLVFEVGGRTVFTKNEVTVVNPGGPGVAGSFERTVETFFSQYFTNTMLQPFLKDLATPEEYAKFFRQGASGGGYSIGIKAGKIYLSSAGMKMI